MKKKQDLSLKVSYWSVRGKATGSETLVWNHKAAARGKVRSEG